jgi:hypothetical protein
MKLNGRVLIAAGVPLLGFLAGCMKTSEKAQSAVNYVITGHAGGAYEPKNVNKYDLENSARIVMLDAGVQRSVTCSGIQEQILGDGRLAVTANLRNRQNRRIEVQANCVFKNFEGFPVNDESPFRTVILTENAQESVRFVSLNDQARTYTIRVRQAR